MIMQDPLWIGTPPGQLYWSDDGNTLYFKWNPEAESESSLYALDKGSTEPYRVSEEKEAELPPPWGSYNRDKTRKVFSRDGDIFLYDINTNAIFRVTQTTDPETNPSFSHREDKILFFSGQNLYAWETGTGSITQLTDFKQGNPPEEKKPYSGDAEKWLYEDQLNLFQAIRDKKEVKDRLAERKKNHERKPPYTIYTGQGRIGNIQLSPDERFITYTRTQTVQNIKQTIVPDFVTESGYTGQINARPKAGTPYSLGSDMFVYDIAGDSVYSLNTSDMPGLSEQPGFVKDYPGRKDKHKNERKLNYSRLVWSDSGENAVVNITSLDNKDRWIMLADIKSGTLSILDHQRDEAWIGGPGIGAWGGTLGWMPDNQHVYFQSEESGYSHLYSVDIRTGRKKALTSGSFEIYDPFVSSDKKHWFFTSNEVHTGERHFYKMLLKGGKARRITFMEGRNDAFLSPDGSMIALLYSASDLPEELYLMENKEGSRPIRITHSFTEEFKAYPWRKPEFITFRARDGKLVPARLYKPEGPVKNGPAVIFVHGAGYLQNAHKWWSSYFREYMFHNFLVDRGYTVLDIDYRGSAGYGRDWRTAIYRNMGGKDLTDHVDGAEFLVKEHNIDSSRIGIYGGSYGGFITLMAMFTQPGVFAAGAALRSVTDWAHYSHGYTANILNTPVEDSLAYIRSSPIYYAEGLEGALLMCHGMVDDNVHFQDIVRLTQRLIELGKDNWELAVYPVESHAFTKPSSWTDEYKRIFRLFETHLK